MRPLGGALLAVAGVTAGAQGQTAEAGGLVTAAMEVDATESGAVGISIRYRVSLAAGAGDVPITVLSPEPASVWGVEVEGPDGPLTVDLPPSSSAQRRGWIRSGTADASDVDLTVTYAVDGAVTEAAAGRLRYTFPVVAIDWPPLDALPGTFQARVHLPEGVVGYEAFPTALVGPGGGGGAQGPTILELSVLPAYVTIRATSGAVPWLTVPGAVDAFVVALLVILGLVGWRRMKETL